MPAPPGCREPGSDDNEDIHDDKPVPPRAALGKRKVSGHLLERRVNLVITPVAHAQYNSILYCLRAPGAWSLRAPKLFLSF